MSHSILYFKSLDAQFQKLATWMLRSNYKRMLLILPNGGFRNKAYGYCKDKKIPVFDFHGCDGRKIGVRLHVFQDSIPWTDVDAIAVAGVSYFKSFEELMQSVSKSGKPYIFLDTDVDKSGLDLSWERESNYKKEEMPHYDKASRHIADREIYKKFIETFEIAEEEIDIVSPWISSAVVDESFIAVMEKALMRGVKVKILYGIGCGESRRSQISREIADMMKVKFARRDFSIREGNIHYKLVLCDTKYMMSGSYNFLSFKGTYDGGDIRQEGVEYDTSARKIRQLRKKYFGW